MKRMAVAALLLAIVALIASLAWQGAARERAFLRLMEAGEASLAADDTFPALEAFSGAIALRGTSMIAHLRRGETYRRRGETGQALRDLRTAARLDPGATRPLELLGDVNADLERYTRASESYEAYLRLDDQSPRVLYKLGLMRLRQGQPAAALPALKAALALDDRLAEAAYLLGVCERALGHPADAVAALERAVRVSPNLVAAREELAELYGAVRRETDALAQLEALAALEPGRVERRMAIGIAHARAGRRDLAVLTLRRIAEEAPENTAVFLALARVWLEAADAGRDRVALRKAFEALAVVSRQAAPDGEALTLLGRAHLLAGEHAAAERAFRQATTRLPVEPAALLELSLAAERAGHLATAREALVRYTAISSDGLPTLDRALHLGDLSLRLNEPAEAVKWFTVATQHEHAPPSAFLRLAQARVRLGDRADARVAVARGLQLDPRDRNLLALERRLRPPGT
ncbi:MAG TPA: tetratricopeptide repeat protein [Vicinamibacterales bacterium]|nr:tetratricopeptide repeat protein [Vicinamibacterales bacterium]